jgi:hypothetical protein
MSSSQQEQQQPSKRPASADERVFHQLTLAFLDTWDDEKRVNGQYFGPCSVLRCVLDKSSGQRVTRSSAIEDVHYDTETKLPLIKIGTYDDRSQASKWNEFFECLDFLFYSYHSWATPKAQSHLPYASLVLAFTEKSRPHVIKTVRDMIQSRIDEAIEDKVAEDQELFERHLCLWDAAFSKDDRVQKFADRFTRKRKAGPETSKDTPSPPPLSKRARVDEEGNQ